MESEIKYNQTFRGVYEKKVLKISKSDVAIKLDDGTNIY